MLTNGTDNESEIRVEFHLHEYLIIYLIHLRLFFSLSHRSRFLLQFLFQFSFLFTSTYVIKCGKWGNHGGRQQMKIISWKSILTLAHWHTQPRHQKACFFQPQFLAHWQSEFLAAAGARIRPQKPIFNFQSQSFLRSRSLLSPSNEGIITARFSTLPQFWFVIVTFFVLLPLLPHCFAVFCCFGKKGFGASTKYKLC